MTDRRRSRGESEDRRPGLDRRGRPHRARAGALADQARRRRADHRQDRRAGDHLAGPGRPGPHAGVLPADGDGRPARRGRRQGRRRSTSGSRAPRSRALPLARYRRGSDALPLRADLPAGRPRTRADRTAGGPGREGRAPDGAGPFRPGRRRRAGDAERPDGSRGDCRRPISRAATARIRSCGRRWRSAFPAGPMRTSSTSPTWRRAARRRTARSTSISTRSDFLVVFPMKGTGRRAPGRHRASRQPAGEPAS